MDKLDKVNSIGRMALVASMKLPPNKAAPGIEYGSRGQKIRMLTTELQSPAEKYLKQKMNGNEVYEVEQEQILQSKHLHLDTRELIGYINVLLYKTMMRSIQLLFLQHYTNQYHQQAHYQVNVCLLTVLPTNCNTVYVNECSMGFSGCGQAVTTCNKVFYKVVVIHAFSLATRLSGPITF